MSKLQHGSPEELEAIRRKAVAHFAPLFLNSALLRLGRACGASSLEQFRKAMLEATEHAAGEDPDLADMKEFAVELLHASLEEIRNAPDGTLAHEDIAARRTPGRSERPETLEDQLQKGLEDSFPASDPPAVVTTAISGRRKV